MMKKKAIYYQFPRYQGKIYNQPGNGKNARIPVLLCLWSRAKKETNQVYLTVNQLKLETGITSNDSIVGALKFLEENGAVYEIPHQFRPYNAPDNPQIKFWQLTGVIRVGGEWLQYQNVTEDQIFDLVAEARRMDVKSVFLEYGQITEEALQEFFDELFDRNNNEQNDIPSNGMVSSENRNGESQSIPNNGNEGEQSTENKRKESSRPASQTTSFGYTPTDDIYTGWTLEDYERQTRQSTMAHPYVQLMLHTCNKQWEDVTEKMYKNKLRAEVSAWNPAKNCVIGVENVLHLWTFDPLYKVWIQTKILPELRNYFTKGPSLSAFLDRTRRLDRYYNWKQSRVGKDAEKQRKSGKSIISQPQEEQLTIVDYPVGYID